MFRKYDILPIFGNYRAQQLRTFQISTRFDNKLAKDKRRLEICKRKEYIYW